MCVFMCFDFGFTLNRTEGYVNMSPPKQELVVQDCDDALKLDITYVKALNRRAAALEALGRHQEALRGALSYQNCLVAYRDMLEPDYTAATILDKFQNEAAAQSVERVLKKISSTEAQEILKASPHSISIGCTNLEHI
jgi:import receptor subunit TOM70